jgi:hypothetical protein
MNKLLVATAQIAEGTLVQTLAQTPVQTLAQTPAQTQTHVHPATQTPIVILMGAATLLAQHHVMATQVHVQVLLMGKDVCGTKMDGTVQDFILQTDIG